MPDPALQTPEREYVETERTPTSRQKPPIDDTMGFHPFVESEFPEGAGRCDRCGGGPNAEIHQKPVDQMARIADALERIADDLGRVNAALRYQHWKDSRNLGRRILDWFFGTWRYI